MNRCYRLAFLCLAPLALAGSCAGGSAPVALLAGGSEPPRESPLPSLTVVGRDPSGCVPEALAGGACGGGGGGDPGDVIMDAIDFDLPNSRIPGEFPEGSGSGPQLDQSFSPPLTQVTPGETATLDVAWMGGPIAFVNLAVGHSSFFQITVNQSQSQGLVNLAAKIDRSLCANLELSNVCQSFHVQLQVVGSQGSVSFEDLRDMVLNCVGSQGCPKRG